MVTKYSEDSPPAPRRVKVYSRTAPLVSNPTYCRTIGSLTRVRHSEIKVASLSLDTPRRSRGSRKNNKRGNFNNGTLMRFNVRPSQKGVLGQFPASRNPSRVTNKRKPYS